MVCVIGGLPLARSGVESRYMITVLGSGLVKSQSPLIRVRVGIANIHWCKGIMGVAQKLGKCIYGVFGVSVFVIHIHTHNVQPLLSFSY